MGGTGIAIDEREAASVLRWWLEMGVDTAIQEHARNWLEQAPQPAPDEPTPVGESPAAETLAAFRGWLASSSGPLSNGSKPVLPVGLEQAEVMVLADLPRREEVSSGAPVGGEAGELLERMLAAIGMAGSAYVANLACFHSPTRHLSEKDLQQCADAARRHVDLARPKRLLLLGEEPCRSLLGKQLTEARGHVYLIEGVRTVATFHPRFLLNRGELKARAWDDLLLLTEEQP